VLDLSTKENGLGINKSNDNAFSVRARSGNSTKFRNMSIFEESSDSCRVAHEERSIPMLETFRANRMRSHL
jgi:hypothetical protein